MLAYPKKAIIINSKDGTKVRLACACKKLIKNCAVYMQKRGIL